MTRDYPAKDESATERLLADKSKSSSDNMKPENDSTRRTTGLDLSKYRQPELVAAIDRLTSFSYSLKLLVQPSLKIAWRSLIYQDAEIRFQDLLSKLSGATKSIAIPPKSEVEGIAQDENLNKKANRPPAPKRSLPERLMHFITVGLPLSILVGVLYGVMNFVMSMWSDVITIWTLSNNLFTQAKSDLQYYRQHPEKRPTKDDAIQAWTQQVVRPYSQEFIRKKLGFFGFVASPIASMIERIGVFFAYRSADNLEKYAAAAMRFSPWRDRTVVGGQPQSVNDKDL